MAKKRKRTTSIKSENKEVTDIMETFRWAYQNAIPHWSRIEADTNAYDNIVDRANWPTMSEVPIPLFLTAVEQALPYAMEYLIPTTKFVELVPRRPIDPEVIDRAEMSLEYTLREKMDLHKKAYATIKDSFKCGVGYGIVEPEYIYPQNEVLYSFGLGGETVAEEIQLQPASTPILSESYRYIAPGQILPTPDGPDPDNVSGLFFIDFYHEHKLRSLLNKNSPFKFNADEIIEEARNFGLNQGITEVQDIVARLGGYQLNKNTGDRHIKVSVPIIKYYTPNEHIWIANGKHIIYRKKNKLETMRCPIVKCSPYPDQNRWFTPGIATNSRELMNTTNVFYNALMDIVTYHLNPVRVLNMRSLGNKVPPREPYTDIHVYDQNDNAVSYMEPPQIPQQLFAIGQQLQQFIDTANGQPSQFSGQGSAGIVRGGANALGALMEDTDIRKRLAGAIMDTGFMKPLVEKTLIMKQLLVPREGEQFPVERYRVDEGTTKRYWDQITVTQKDLRHSLTVRVNLRAKLRNSNVDMSVRQAEFDRLKDDPFIDQYALREELLNDDAKVRRLVLPREEIERRQQEAKAQAEAEAQAAQAQQAGTTQADQANAGFAGPAAAQAQAQ